MLWTVGFVYFGWEGEDVFLGLWGGCDVNLRGIYGILSVGCFRGKFSSYPYSFLAYIFSNDRTFLFILGLMTGLSSTFFLVHLIFKFMQLCARLLLT